MAITVKEVPLEIRPGGPGDSAGKAKSAAAALRSITRRRQTKAELIEYRKQLEALVEMRTAELNATNRELRLRLEWLTAVNLVNQIVARSADYAEIFGKITEIINRLFMPDDSFITELDARGRQLKILAHSSGDLSPALIGSLSTIPEGIRLQPDLSLGELIFLSQEEISELNGPLGVHIQVAGPQSLVLIPLLVREQVLGFLGLEWEEEGRAITSEGMQPAGIFSTDIAQIMVNARLFEQAKMLIATEERNRLARDLHELGNAGALLCHPGCGSFAADLGPRSREGHAKPGKTTAPDAWCPG